MKTQLRKELKTLKERLELSEYLLGQMPTNWNTFDARREAIGKQKKIMDRIGYIENYLIHGPDNTIKA